MTTYRRFIETNDNEGETWNFWLQVDGNITALAILGDHLDMLYEDFEEWDECPFVLEDDQLEGHEVDLLIRFGDSGYMDQHNKVEGSLMLPKDFGFADFEAVTKYLYKGGIRNFLQGRYGVSAVVKIEIDSPLGKITAEQSAGRFTSVDYGPEVEYSYLLDALTVAVRRACAAFSINPDDLAATEGDEP